MTTDTSTAVTARLRALIEAELPRLIDIRHDLHAHPELMYEEHRTADVVQRCLAEAGVEFQGGLAGGTGVLGHLGGEADSALGLRADMDALPILEASGVPYSSNHEGVMHACGHDGHTTMLIGAATILSKLSKEQSLPQPVTFVFQPAEEGGAGGKRMVEDGCLNGSVIGPRVHSMFGLHGWPDLHVGSVGSRPGPMLAAADMFETTITGLGSHAAYPQNGRDPVLAASAITQAVQQIASRNVGPLDSVVVSVTKIHGGTAHNVIPQTVTIGGTVRTLLEETRQLAKSRLQEIIESTARAYGCDVEFTYHDGYPVTRNDVAAVDFFHDLAADALGETKVAPLADPVMGGEDFSFYCNEVPSCFFALGLIPEGESEIPNLHHPAFDFNDDAMATGIEMFCRIALNAPQR